MSDWIEYKNEKGQTVYFNKTVSDHSRAQSFINFFSNRLESQVWRSLGRDLRFRVRNSSLQGLCQE